MTPEERAVIEAARAWWASPGLARDDFAAGDLSEAVRALEAAERDARNEPDSTATPQPRAWMYIPAGWFVQAKPGGPWYEVLANVQTGVDQVVTLRDMDGKVGTWGRPRRDQVAAVPGTVMGEVGEAIAVLGHNVEIIDDHLEGS